MLDQRLAREESITEVESVRAVRNAKGSTYNQSLCNKSVAVKKSEVVHVKGGAVS